MIQPEGMNIRRLAQEREQARRLASQSNDVTGRQSAARFEALDQEWWRRPGVSPVARNPA